MDLDIIFISDLRVETVIGVYAWERRIKQTVRIDLEMAVAGGKAARRDALEDALDYRAVSASLRRVAADSRAQLVETLAERMAENLLQDFRLPWLRLKLNKLGAVPGAAGVGVIIERGKRD